MRAYLVCDGGGSKTEFLLFWEDGRVLAHTRGPGANALFLPQEKAAQAVCRGIGACLEKGGLTAGELAGTGLFIPGFGPCLEQVRRFLGHDRVQLAGDEKNAFYAALGGPAGIAVLSGTGSFATGRGRGGKEATAGGWGPLFSDEGSGYHIGAMCLNRLAWLHDRGLEGTLLEKLALEALGAPDVLSLRRLAYQPGFDRSAVAALCPAVAAAARGGDERAGQILDTAAAALAGLAKTVADTLGETALPVALTGGVARMGDLMEDRFRAALAGALPACRWQRARYAPVVGAALCVLAETAGVDLCAADLGESLTKGMNGGTDLC